VWLSRALAHLILRAKLSLRNDAPTL